MERLETVLHALALVKEAHMLVRQLVPAQGDESKVSWERFFDLEHPLYEAWRELGQEALALQQQAKEAA